MQPTKLLVLSLFLPLFCLSQETTRQLPRFEDFADSEAWSGAQPKVVVDNPHVRMFRSQFREAASKPPNFAGHYRIAIWGCGTQCLEGGAIDLATGKAMRLPASGRQQSAGYWMVCYSAFDPSGVESRADSNLLIIRCADIIGKRGGSYLRTSYFAFENETFRKIAETRGERVF